MPRLVGYLEDCAFKVHYESGWVDICASDRQHVDDSSIYATTRPYSPASICYDGQDNYSEAS